MKYLFLDVDGTLINYNTQLTKIRKTSSKKKQQKMVIKSLFVLDVVVVK